jgi:hypothetical protein
MHTETATCRGCGVTFERETTTERRQVYCTEQCQYATRSAEYRERPDIYENLNA